MLKEIIKISESMSILYLYIDNFSTTLVIFEMLVLMGPLTTLLKLSKTFQVVHLHSPMLSQRI